MNNNIEVLSLFPTSISKGRIDNISVAEELLKQSYDLKPNSGNLSSKLTYILDDPRFLVLKEELETRLNYHLQAIYAPCTRNASLSLYITQSWLNVTESSEYHHRHKHVNSVFSGVLYLDVITSDSITFFRGVNDLTIDFDREEYTINNSDRWTISGFKRGDLIVFPSTLEHEVPSLDRDSSTPRVSIAFNSYFIGEIGNADHYTRLSLS
jgi:uncharacterized protein (TIGR02466 family)